MARRFQKVHSYTFDSPQKRGDDKEHTEKSSFSTLERAIQDAYMWINKSEAWIDTTVTHIEIIDKESKEVVWQYRA